MVHTSRLRLSAGLIALTLTLGACGGPDKGAPAPDASPSSVALPSGSPAPSNTAAPTPSASSSGSSTPSSGSSTPSASSSASAEAQGSAEATASAEGGASAAGSSSAPGSASGSSTGGSSAAAAGAGSATLRSAERPAPVAIRSDVVPAAQNLGGAQAGVAPKDTPVSVTTPKPAIPVEKVAPEDVRPPATQKPAAPSTPAATTPATAGPSGSTAPSPAAGSSTAPTTAPTTVPPVSQGAVDCAVARCVALTFDDGPGRYTGRLLNILSAEQVPATFYVVGENAALNPSLLARMAAEGHQVGNHSYSHPNLTTLSAAQVVEEMSRTDAAIRAAGVTPSTVRAPYGALNEAVLADFATLPRSGSVTWSVDTRDWQHKDPAQTLANVQAQTRPGGIILMHDIHATTVDAVPSVIAWLKSQGYTFVTVDKITGGVAPGRTTGSGMHP